MMFLKWVKTVLGCVGWLWMRYHILLLALKIDKRPNLKDIIWKTKILTRHFSIALYSLPSETPLCQLRPRQLDTVSPCPVNELAQVNCWGDLVSYSCRIQGNRLEIVWFMLQVDSKDNSLTTYFPATWQINYYLPWSFLTKSCLRIQTSSLRARSHLLVRTTMTASTTLRISISRALELSRGDRFPWHCRLKKWWLIEIRKQYQHTKPSGMI